MAQCNKGQSQSALGGESEWLGGGLVVTGKHHTIVLGERCGRRLADECDACEREGPGGSNDALVRMQEAL